MILILIIFAQQIWGLGKAGDTLLAISTSGNSRNVVLAAKVARAKHITVIGLTGEGGGLLAPHCDVLIDVPSDDVAVFKRCIYQFTTKFVSPSKRIISAASYNY